MSVGGETSDNAAQYRGKRVGERKRKDLDRPVRVDVAQNRINHLGRSSRKLDGLTP